MSGVAMVERSATARRAATHHQTTIKATIAYRQTSALLARPSVLSYVQIQCWTTQQLEDFVKALTRPVHAA